jgi:hypothetical protein
MAEDGDGGEKIYRRKLWSQYPFQNTLSISRLSLAKDEQEEVLVYFNFDVRIFD